MPKANYYDFISVEHNIIGTPVHQFELKTLILESTFGVIWEFSCGCCIQFPCHRSSELVLKKMKENYEGRLCRKSTSLWGDNWSNQAPTEHFLCRKDPRLAERLSDLTFLQEEYFHLMPGVSIVPVSDFQEASLAMKLMMTFTRNISVPEKNNDFKKAKKLPEALRKTLEAENSKKEKLTDKELEDLFAQPSTKKSKKSTKKNPNKGKAPNNIRKTKKPVKL